MQVTEIGSCAAILAGLSTKVDGSIKVVLEINPTEQEILSRLLKLFATNEKLLQVAFIKVDG
jgi:hypothetical protein